MGNYMDSSFVVVDGTIISYSGQQNTLSIPERFANIEVSRIGDGAFMESFQLKRIVLPSNVKEIGTQAFWQCDELAEVLVSGEITDVGMGAFSGCNNLHSITICGLKLSADEYHTFKILGKKSDNIYVLCEMPNNELVSKLVSSINSAKAACKIPENITSLFRPTDVDEKKTSFSIEKNIPFIGFTVPSVSMTENNAFFCYMKSSKKEDYNGKAEEKNDWYVRVGKIPARTKTIIFTFDDSKTKEKNGRFMIEATLKIGYFFWQSAQAVVYENKKYYIYRRHYLSSDPELEYVRRDIAVYTDEGIVNNREEAQKVYAKYKLLSIL